MRGGMSKPMDVQIEVEGTNIEIYRWWKNEGHREGQGKGWGALWLSWACHWMGNGWVDFSDQRACWKIWLWAVTEFTGPCNKKLEEFCGPQGMWQQEIWQHHLEETLQPFSHLTFPCPTLTIIKFQAISFSSLALCPSLSARPFSTSICFPKTP